MIQRRFPTTESLCRFVVVGVPDKTSKTHTESKK